jgi:hypothetical protein
LQLNSVTFDTGDLHECAFSQNATVISNHPNFGRNALRLLRQNSVAYAEIRGPSGRYYDVPIAFYRFYFLYGEKATPAAGHTPVCAFHDTSNQAKAALYLSSDGRLQFQKGKDSVLDVGDTALKQGGVYMLQARIGTGEEAAWELCVNGKVELSGKADLGSRNNGGTKLGGDGWSLGDRAHTDDFFYGAIAIDDGNYPPPVRGIVLAE